MRAHKSLSLVLGKIIHFVLKLISIWLKNTNYSLNNFTQSERDGVKDLERELHSFASLAVIVASAQDKKIVNNEIEKWQFSLTNFFCLEKQT